VLVSLAFLLASTNAQIPKLTLDFTKPGTNVSPMIFGLMTKKN